MSEGPIRLAIVGGNRGGRFRRTLEALAGLVRLTAICDIREDVLLQWREEFPAINTYNEYADLLDDPDVDAVLLASPMLLHARQSIEALNAGKHVLCEVIAAHTIEEAWELVEAAERSGRIYMMAENYGFERESLTVRHLAERGLFGEITYLEGGYIHDLRHAVHQPDGRLTWRGQLHWKFNGMNYPTHSIGPLAQWLGLGLANGDRLETLATFVSNSRALRRYYQDRFGSDHPAAQEGFWKQGDCAVTNITTASGVLITLRVDWTSPRPHNMHHYALQGTEGAYLSRRHDGEDDLIWLAKRPKGLGPAVASGAANGEPDSGEARWEPLGRYWPAYDHPLWSRMEQAAGGGEHGGSNQLTLESFALAVREKRRPPIDVYDAVDWSSIFALSMESVAKGGAPVAFPNYRIGSERRRQG